MDFKRILFVALFCLVSISLVGASPRWKFFKKLERVGQHIRDGIIKAGPAVAVVGQASSLG